MITLVTAIIMIFATMYSLLFSLRNELFRFLIYETLFARLIVSIGILILLGGGFFIASSIAPTMELAVVLGKMGAISIRVSIAILWFTNSYLINQRYSRLEALAITSVLSASMITYALSPMKAVRVYGFWERGFYNKLDPMSTSYIDTVFVGILIMGTIISQIYALVSIRKNLSRPIKITDRYFVGSALIIFAGFVTWVLIRWYGALDYVFNGVLNIVLALMVLLWTFTIGSTPQILVLTTTHIRAFLIYDKTRPNFRFVYNPEKIPENIIETLRNLLDVQRIVLFNRRNLSIYEDNSIRAIFYTDNYNELLKATMKFIVTKIKESQDPQTAGKYVELILPQV